MESFWSQTWQYIIPYWQSFTPLGLEFNIVLMFFYLLLLWLTQINKYGEYLDGIFHGLERTSDQKKESNVSRFDFALSRLHILVAKLPRACKYSLWKDYSGLQGVSLLKCFFAFLYCAHSIIVQCQLPFIFSISWNESVLGFHWAVPSKILYSC